MKSSNKSDLQKKQDKRVLGNWYDNSKQEKAKEKRRQKKGRIQRRVKQFKWIIVAVVMFTIGIFLLNNFDSFLRRTPTMITYLGRGEPSGFFIMVSDREYPIWVHQLEWEALSVGQEIVIRETSQGPRIEDVPLSMFQRLFPN